MAACDVKYGFYNFVDQSSTDIAGDAENALYPSANIKNPFSTKVYRSTTASDGVVFDFKTTEAVDLIMVRPDQKNGWGFSGDLTIEANFVDSWSSPPYSTTLTPDLLYGIATLQLSSAENYRFWRISGAGSSYFELSNVFIGSAFQAQRNISLGWSIQNKDRSKLTDNADGQSFITNYQSKKELSASIKFLDKTGQDELDKNIEYAGKVKPIWLVMDPTATFSSDVERFTGVYYLTDKTKWTNPNYNYYSTTLSLKECK